ncbi:glycosyltransferase [Laspinema sp. D1]|uniref:CgeB family protein n=1 Tax=Laspinema palackyanum TaxID=3231601 RepID=UPI00349A408B|nr:glycosyltransferase [Laspinema sp. D2b]
MKNKSKLRIFYAASSTPNANFPFKSSLWRQNLYSPLIDMGHDVVELEYDLDKTFKYLDLKRSDHKKFIDKNRPQLSLELLKQIKKAHQVKPVDLFFSYFYDACVLPEAIDEIRSLGITTVNWYCNGSYQLDLVSEISPHYDWCLVPEKFRIPDYVAMGANPLYCQEAANPNIYKPYDLPKEFDVTFVGQAYGERPSYIKHLVENNINIKVWGQWWQNYSRRAKTASLGRRLMKPQVWQRAFKILFQQKINAEEVDFFKLTLPEEILGGLLSDQEMIQMYSRSKINLGFSTCSDTHKSQQRIVQIRLRDFEVPMSGGFYMVEYMEELEEFFKIDQEIVCYRDADDLLDKIKYYLNREDERERIRRAGMQRARQEHTWHKRFEMIFKQIGLL